MSQCYATSWCYIYRSFIQDTQNLARALSRNNLRFNGVYNCKTLLYTEKMYLVNFLQVKASRFRDFF